MGGGGGGDVEMSSLLSYSWEFLPLQIRIIISVSNMNTALLKQMDHVCHIKGNRFMLFNKHLSPAV